MEIIAFTGKKSSGKTTALEVLEHYYSFNPQNFADPVKVATGFVYGLKRPEVEDPVLKETVLDRWPFKSPRYLLQKVGTEMFRAEDEDVWIQFMKRNLSAMPEEARVVIGDLRFPNEAAMVKEMGGIIVRIEREGLESDDTHSSETLMDSIEADIVITNDCKTAAEFKGKVNDWYKSL